MPPLKTATLHNEYVGGCVVGISPQKKKIKKKKKRGIYCWQNDEAKAVACELLGVFLILVSGQHYNKETSQDNVSETKNAFLN